ncbi:protein FAR-RED ELONGATED HYPOCOTYL 3-like [Prosopis cineraria]|uniref:protein FAR-RED ELONGATED HYPOCOTYL 3-like n=1 Tax=Prosopis cineraria TaxID=364024 RepID=UPI002410AC37|nr:protein FAR-RED ELONGATED HYPOCOTYL 3-like [Prosopis cineraria]XP_054814496.1 protein FAR-RED ELONGATED HYPOCOTYL 3-like [Prosopis cineraria]XP_054814497.1 protein FAR-RED ELONGATED HYPOCOTYL 3-like [Prosopis cineraria]XP_054814498.1 protein FAR-RED ELONGATED HYPOCOTYL 3-like [Prosopis cineraria]XP_054814499.1 protein FAR-RED ELONGATED HYPOCOTYL 3-like [Prosopis cineraria]XP_054814500.1 protein FAR-RED ELONGATED HYPOCOTYL 3-like [Prosopis cineraria]
MEAPLDDGNRDVQTSGDAGMSTHEVQINQEPYEGLSFESEKAAREFYDNYASREGFTTRVLSSRKSERDGSIISRGLGCRGVSYSRTKTTFEKQDRQNVCTAMILLKREKDGEWVIRKFVRDHNHPVMVDLEKTPRTLDEKDKKIQELTAEVRIKKRLSASYREQLETLLKDVEGHSEHISKKIHLVNETLRKLDARMGKLPEIDQ